MAAVTCLVAQSSLLPNVESMIEYLTMSRGGNLVLSQLLPDIEKSLFRGMSMEGHIGTLQRLITDQPKDWELLDQFEASVLGIRPLCPTDNEIKYMNALVRCSTALRASTLNGKTPMPLCGSFLTFER